MSGCLLSHKVHQKDPQGNGLVRWDFREASRAAGARPEYGVAGAGGGRTWVGGMLRCSPGPGPSLIPPASQCCHPHAPFPTSVKGAKHTSHWGPDGHLAGGLAVTCGWAGPLAGSVTRKAEKQRMACEQPHSVFTCSGFCNKCHRCGDFNNSFSHFWRLEARDPGAVHSVPSEAASWLAARSLVTVS